MERPATGFSADAYPAFSCLTDLLIESTGTETTVGSPFFSHSGPGVIPAMVKLPLVMQI